MSSLGGSLLCSYLNCGFMTWWYFLMDHSDIFSICVRYCIFGLYWNYIKHILKVIGSLESILEKLIYAYHLQNMNFKATILHPVAALPNEASHTIPYSCFLIEKLSIFNKSFAYSLSELNFRWNVYSVSKRHIILVFNSLLDLGYM